MSGWRHAGLTCDACGELFCCHYDSVKETRAKARDENWTVSTLYRRNGMILCRQDLCDACTARETMS